MLAKFEHAIVLPINRGLQSTHWILAVLPSIRTPELIQLFDPMGLPVLEHTRKVVKLVPGFLPPQHEPCRLLLCELGPVNVGAVGRSELKSADSSHCRTGTT